jgi:tight adherence protein C
VVDVPPLSGIVVTRTVLPILWAVLVATTAVGRRPRPVLPEHLPSVGARPAASSPPRRRRRRRNEIADQIPDVVDLFAVATAAGLNPRLATSAVAERAPPGPIADALRAAIAQVDHAGSRLADALDDLPTLLGDDAIRPLVSALTDAERYGAALGPTLDRLADDARRARQRRAEEAARRLPVKLLFPLVTCILPAFGLLTVAPLIAGGLRALRL